MGDLAADQGRIAGPGGLLPARNLTDRQLTDLIRDSPMRSGRLPWPRLLAR